MFVYEYMYIYIYIVQRFQVRYWDQYCNVLACRRREDVSGHPQYNPAGYITLEVESYRLNEASAPKEQLVIRLPFC